jgi:hypothetical protein
MEMEKTRHDWNIQREDKIAQSENTKERVGTIKDIIEHSVKPTLGEFAKGYGEAMARQKWEAEQQKMAAVQQRRARMAAMNRQQMGGGIPPQQQQHQQQQQQQQFYRQQQQAQQQQMPPQQQHQQPYPPQEQRPSRHQQEMQRNIINEEKIAQMSMEEIPSCRGQSISRTWWTQTW